MLTAVGPVAAALTHAWAQNPKPLASFGDWHARTFEESGKVGCYIIAGPIDSEGDYTSRGATYAVVTHRPAKQSFNVVAIIAGYAYKQDSKVTIEIGDRVFALFTDKDMAWAYDEDDRKLVESMRRGLTMTVRGISSRHTVTIDTYSLAGFTKAHNAMPVPAVHDIERRERYRSTRAPFNSLRKRRSHKPERRDRGLAFLSYTKLRLS